MGSRSSDRPDTIDDERASLMVSLLMTGLKPAPSAPRVAAAGLYLIRPGLTG
jgi:hypothetical protein